MASGGGHSSTSLPSSSWLGASEPIQEGPESGVDDGEQSTLENPAQRITTTSTFEIYYTQYMGRCTTRALRKVAVREALELSKVLQLCAERAPDFTGQDFLPCGWELMQLRWSMPCGRVLNAATKCGRKLLGSKCPGGVPLFKHDELHMHISKRMPQLLFCRC